MNKDNEIIEQLEHCEVRLAEDCKALAFEAKPDQEAMMRTAQYMDEQIGTGESRLRVWDLSQWSDRHHKNGGTLMPSK